MASGQFDLGASQISIEPVEPSLDTLSIGSIAHYRSQTDSQISLEAAVFSEITALLNQAAPPIKHSVSVQ